MSQPPMGQPLSESLETDVCVIGAGIAGMTSAYLVAKAGKSVAVVDDGPIGAGMSQMTSAHLSYEIDDFYFELEKLHGEEGAKLAAESHRAAIARIEAISREEGIDCEFARVDGYLFLAEGDKPETLDRELAAAHRAGLTDVEKMARAPFESFDSGPCLRFPNAGQFHPLKYLAGLAQAIQRNGGRIFTGAHADNIDSGDPARVKVGRHTIAARSVVVATNVPVNDRLAIHTKQAPYMTYVIGARVRRGYVPSILAWDTGDPYHYIRVEPFGEDDILVVGGEDHKSGQADDQQERYARLEAWTRARFPMVKDIAFRWGGQIMETVDYLAFSGRNPADKDNVYVHTGDSGMGLTHGTIGGMLISDLILGRDNSWAKLYDPSRKPVKAAGEYASENLNVARQYAEYFTGGEVDSAAEIPAGEGALIRRGLHKLAVYRSPSGEVYERSAVCPHLGCLVQWNSTEKTWDCPCHGSRFDRHGMVINGPANRDLAPRAPAEDEHPA